MYVVGFSGLQRLNNGSISQSYQLTLNVQNECFVKFFKINKINKITVYCIYMIDTQCPSLITALVRIDNILLANTILNSLILSKTIYRFTVI